MAAPNVGLQDAITAEICDGRNGAKHQAILGDQLIKWNAQREQILKPVLRRRS